VQKEFKGDKDLEDYLDNWAADNWELVFIGWASEYFGGTFVFKKLSCSYCNDVKEVAAMDPDCNLTMVPCRKCNRDALIKYIEAKGCESEPDRTVRPPTYEKLSEGYDPEDSNG